jgi:hypothetical protein
MQGNDVQSKKDEEGMQTTDTVNGGEEDDRSTGVSKEEVIEVDVLQ